MKKHKRTLITCAEGFIESHFEKYLKEKGYRIHSVDLVYYKYMDSTANEFLILDLKRKKNCIKAKEGKEEVCNFAANIGGIGFIKTVKAEVMHDNVLINTHMLEASQQNQVKRFFFPSSACVYPTYKQKDSGNLRLKEDDLYPANPDNEYCWEKLFTE